MRLSREAQLRERNFADKLESLDYDDIESELYLDELKQKTTNYFRILNVERWVMTFLIGVVVGLIAFGVQMAVKFVANSKFQFVAFIYRSCDDCYWAPLLAMIGANLILATIAAGGVLLISAPAKGSGIPEVKAYLNGIKMPEVLRIKTVMVKLVGVVCAVAGGFAVGKEGPMIHMGVVVAGGLSQGKSTTFKIFNTQLFSNFQNDQEKRDFVSGGAAAGVAAAFGAPVGGVLLTLEEGVSFWKQSLTWRTFFCAVIATFTINLFLSGVETDSHWGNLSNRNLIDFGDFTGQQDRGYEISSIPFFIILGIIGGVLGGLFNFVNKKLMILRMNYVSSPRVQFMEALGISVLTSIVTFSLTSFVHQCYRLPSPLPEDINNTESTVYKFFCPDDYYNDMALLFGTTQESAIRLLLHSEGITFSTPTLATFTVVYFILSLISCGLAIPAALFVPALILGAAYGRLFGNLVGEIFQTNMSAGTLALIGAAASLGGITRMTISLTVIMMEATGDMLYGLPLMITLMFSKWVGDLFGKGIYDIHLELKEVPVLEWESPILMRKYKARNIMKQPAICFKKVDNVGHIYNILKETRHNGFPVIDDHGTLKGLILRSQLITLLKKKIFQPNKRGYKQPYNKVPLTTQDFQEDYPRFPSIDSVTLDYSEQAQFIDLTPFMNQTPYTVRQSTTLMRVFSTFRTIGLRHMVVVDDVCKVVGVITRKNLVHFEEFVRKSEHDKTTIGGDEERINLLLKDDEEDDNDNNNNNNNNISGNINDKFNTEDYYNVVENSNDSSDKSPKPKGKSSRGSRRGRNGNEDGNGKEHGTPNGNPTDYGTMQQ